MYAITIINSLFNTFVNSTTKRIKKCMQYVNRIKNKYFNKTNKIKKIIFKFNLQVQIKLTTQ